MKRNLIFPALFLLVAFLSSCQKQSIETTENSNLNKPTESKTVNASAAEFDMEEYNQMVAENNARLALLGLDASRDCVETAMVPDDFATIQEAVDAVCPGGNVIVKAGTYTEVVFVNKAGLHIKAIGEVTLNGGFNLTADADGAMIQKFNIIMDGGYGINALGVSNVAIMQNVVSGTTLTGIRFYNCSGVSVKQNHVSGMHWGIFIGATVGFSSTNNTIQNNTVTGITFSSCIGLQGDCDNNLILGNTVTDNPNVSNAGVMLLGADYLGGFCDYNVVKNNVVSGFGYVGCWLLGGSNNTVGPNNTFNDNTYYGIYLSSGASDNHTFNNTALNNTLCDITNEGGPNTNTFKNNTADCTVGL